MEAILSVFLAAENKRNQAAARHGATGDVGSYQMGKDARLLLADQKLDLPISPLVPVLFKPFPLVKLSSASVSIVVLEFKTSFVVTGLPDAGAAALADGLPTDSLAAAMAAAAGITDLVTIANEWDTPAPAADTITLETSP